MDRLGKQIPHHGPSYGATDDPSHPTRHHSEIVRRPSSEYAHPPLVARHSSDAQLVSRRISNFSDSANVYNGQLIQMRDGVSLGLGGYSSHLNLLLIFVPAGMAAALFKLSPLFVFVFNFLAMIPLAMLLGKATEDIAEHTNETLGALVNVTFGNAVELIISISALRIGKLELVQDTIAGSVLSNLLLVLGSAFFFGGLCYREQEVLPAVSEANADLLSFAVFGFSIPALFAIAINPSADGQSSSPLHRSLSSVEAEERVSLVTSICLLLIYGMYLLFQLYTHAELYQAVGDGGGSRPSSADALSVQRSNGVNASTAITFVSGSEDAGLSTGDLRAASGVETVEDEESDDNVASLPVAIGILVAMVALVAISSELLVSSIDGFSERVGLGQKFIAVILLPVVGNAVEHMSAILVATHDKIDLSIGIACGSSVQIALFAAPVLVVISWVFGYEHLTLDFQLFETICIGFTVFVVNATLRDSRTNWLEGAVLIVCYMIIATAFYFMG